MITKYMKVQRSDGWLMFLQNVMALRVREDCDVRRILLDGWYWNFQNCEVRHSTQFDSFLVAFSPYQEVMSFMSSIGQTNEWSLLETMGERLLQQYYRCTFFLALQEIVPLCIRRNCSSRTGLE